MICEFNLKSWWHCKRQRKVYSWSSFNVSNFMNNYNKKLSQFCNQFVERDSREKSDFANERHEVDSFHAICIATSIKYYQLLICELHNICFIEVVFSIDHCINSWRRKEFKSSFFILDFENCCVIFWLILSCFFWQTT